jgi:hypothetical protein
MTKTPGKLPDMTQSSGLPYRRYIVGLPLQRSIFANMADAAATIGLPGLSSPADFPARLDANGNLFLDRSKAAALSDAFLASMCPEILRLIHVTHSRACDDLLRVTENATRVTASLDRMAVRVLWIELAQKMTLILAYGVLSKFIPDVLLRSLRDAGDTEAPPFPRQSAGARLMQHMFGLFEACCAHGYPPQRLQRHWPDVSAEVVSLVRRFCYDQTGFGPLAWDSPGYEDPAYVIRLLHSAFDEVNADQLRQRIPTDAQPDKPPAVKVTAEIATIRRLLGFWLDFLERETWYVRYAFYRGMIPLLKRVAADYRDKTSSFRVEDTLFLEMAEVTAATVNTTDIEIRRQSYFFNTEYLAMHGIGPNRLTRMFET